MTTLGASPAWQAGGRIDAGRLSVVFEWQGDRFFHVILVDGLAVLTSVEGQPEVPWPASPPAQSLMIDNNAAGLPRAMLVGMAGVGHWSASIEAVEEGRAILFDLACRLRGPESRLSSTYALSDGSTLSPAPLNGPSWTLARANSQPDLNVGLAVDLRDCRGELEGQRWSLIVPEPSAPSGGARTLRWGFLIRAQDSLPGSRP